MAQYDNEIKVDFSCVYLPSHTLPNFLHMLIFSQLTLHDFTVSSSSPSLKKVCSINIVSFLFFLTEKAFR